MVRLDTALKNSPNLTEAEDAFEDQTAQDVSPAVNHHSLLAETGGRIQRFREFIVFHGDRVYPEYLVAYHRR